MFYKNLYCSVVSKFQTSSAASSVISTFHIFFSKNLISVFSAIRKRLCITPCQIWETSVPYTALSGPYDFSWLHLIMIVFIIIINYSIHSWYWEAFLVFLRCVWHFWGFFQPGSLSKLCETKRALLDVFALSRAVEFQPVKYLCLLSWPVWLWKH